MLIDAVVIILRETLEAAILISVLISISNSLNIKLHWLLLSVVLGILSAVGYVLGLSAISTWFDYVGQEIVNAAIQYLIYIFLLITAVLAANRYHQKKVVAGLVVAMASASMLALIREGAEIILFFSGFISVGQMMGQALTSGFIGLTIGLSVGALFYFAIMLCPNTVQVKLQIVLLSFIAAGMVAQATQLLIQADWLSSTKPLWDSSGVLSEQSVVGQLAYATFGYEATPTTVMVVVYLLALFLIPSVIAVNRLRSSVISNQ